MLDIICARILDKFSNITFSKPRSQMKNLFPFFIRFCIQDNINQLEYMKDYAQRWQESLKRSISQKKLCSRNIHFFLISGINSFNRKLSPKVGKRFSDHIKLSTGSFIYLRWYSTVDSCLENLWEKKTIELENEIRYPSGTFLFRLISLDKLRESCAEDKSRDASH